MSKHWVPEAAAVLGVPGAVRTGGESRWRHRRSAEAGLEGPQFDSSPRTTSLLPDPLRWDKPQRKPQLPDLPHNAL